MRYLYKGNKKIRTAVIKNKVNSDFITAGPNDILVGKTSIDVGYNTITGTMEPITNLADVTSDATAEASNITSGKTGYKNGIKVTGTAIRLKPSDFVDGIISSYKVANHNVISAGDFVKFVEEICGCGYETMTKTSVETNIYNSGSMSSVVSYLYNFNKVFLLFSPDYTTYYSTMVTIDNGTITFVQPTLVTGFTFSNVPIITSIGNGQLIMIHYSRAVKIDITSDGIITFGDSLIVTANNGFIRRTIPISSDELFVTYEGIDSDGDTTLNFSIIKLVDGELTASINIPADRVLYVKTNGHAICKIADDRILLVSASLFNGSSSYTVLDISNRSNIIFGSINNLVTLSSYGFDIKLIEENTALVTFTMSDSSGYTIPYATCFKWTESGLLTHNRGFGNSSMSITRTMICQLTDSLILMGIISSGDLKIIPIFRTAGSVEFTYGTLYNFGVCRDYANMVKVENNKILVTYGDYDNKLLTKLVQVNNDGTFTEILTVYDMTKPLTQTMVTLSKNGDRIDGIANEDGIGKLYGGTTIEVVTPNV